MKLRKTRENKIVSYNTDGIAVEEPTAWAQYDVVDEEGKPLGNATVYPSRIEMSLNLPNVDNADMTASFLAEILEAEATEAE